MQWTPDRNGGFSQADFASLFLPPLMDPVYGFQALNVEAQRRDPGSFLHWTRRILEVRKRHRDVFGTGSLEVLDVENPAVLAYVRRLGGESLLCVNNLSRFPRAAELHLGPFEGLRPVELFGLSVFPRISTLPYVITLAEHGFFWFRLTEAGPESVPTAQGCAEVRAVGL